MSKTELEYRTRNLHPDYEMREVLYHGLGLFPVNKTTGEVCNCNMKWDKEGKILSCTKCNFDGT